MTEEEFTALKARLKASAALGNAPASRTTRQPTKREQLLADGFTFSVRDQDRAEGAAEHRARRRLAEEETAARARVWQRLRDTQGRDAADAWLRDAG